jgi:DNA-binding NarL/FixJ family response regulator
MSCPDLNHKIEAGLRGKSIMVKFDPLLRLPTSEEKQREAIAQLSSLGLSAEQIAGALGLSVQYVEQAIDNC